MQKFSRVCLALALTALTACSDDTAPGAVDSNNGDNPANNGNNGPANNGANNGPANNGPANNGANNGPANNGANNGPANNGANNGPANNGQMEGLTWYKDIKPITDRNCTGCHTDGGIGGFPLETYAEVSALSAQVRQAVESGSMPPWLPAPDCRDFLGERRLTPAHIGAIGVWIDAAMPEGDPTDDPQVQRPVTTLEDADMILRAAQPYTANADRPDDYRCLVLDHEFDRDTYLSAYQVVPDQRAIVHHVLFYLVPAAEVRRLPELEAEDAAPGYECFGGPRAGDLLGTVAGWVPGSVPTHYPEGSAYVIPAGSRIVMQVHYNLLVGDPVADRTEIHMRTLPEPPPNQIKILPIPDFELNLPAGQARVREGATYPNIFGKTLTIVGTAPHMHMLGTEIRARINGQGGQECIVEIPDYDFAWQQFYEFEPSSYIQFAPGDSVSVECIYDNSEANQPVVNGEQLQPRDVDWGDGSLDEMCLLYLTTMEPFEGVSTCGNFAACNEGCDDDDGACTLSCVSNGGGDCRQCGLFGLGECAVNRCGNIAQGALPCLLGCLQQPDVGVCLADSCPDQLDALWGCLGPAFYDGQCNGQIEDCGLAQ